MKKNNLIISYNNLFNDNFCKEIIDYFNENSNLHERRNANVTKKALTIVDTFLPLESPNPLIKKFSSIFYKDIMPDYLNKIKIRNNNLLSLNPFHQIQKIEPTEGKHGFYCERCTGISSYLILGYTLFLNNIDEGGELEFLFQHHRIKPKKGSICLFPVNTAYLQRDNTPLSNTRYTISGWVGYFN